jgi:predicted dehydrogenase
VRSVAVPGNHSAVTTGEASSTGTGSSSKGGRPVRIGILGAARIVPAALVKPSHAVGEVALVAVAARDKERATAFARKHGIPKVHDSYEDLVDDPELDAVYIPLPNGLHGLWTQACLEAGKHVLCEKPFTANAEEADRVQAAAASSGLVVMEAFHWRYHPLATRLLEIVASGELGELRRVEAALCFPLPRWSDIRWQPDLAGGALMDPGCYAIHIVRTLSGMEPSVASARIKVRTPEVDRFAHAELRFADGVSGSVTSALWSGQVLRTSARVIGERGSMRILNPVAPHAFNLVTVKSGGTTRRERVRGAPTYEYQLRAFASAVRDGIPVLTPPSDSVANMRVIDEIYRRGGLQPRPGALV